MKELSFATGLVSYSLNGKQEVSFNPTDSAFVERLFKTFDELDKKQDEYKSEMEKIADNKEIFDLARKRDEEMRAMIDSVFDHPVCEAVFGGMNVYAMGDGLPAWVNLLLVVMDEIDTSFAREQKAMNPRLQKYMNRWKKK